MIKRIKSGVHWFDDLIGGGYTPNSINLLAGGTGTGKTIFCLQFLYNGAKDFNEKGIYISFEESNEDLKQDAAEIGFNFSTLGDKVKFLHIPPYQITDFLNVLKEEVLIFDPKRLVLDSISALSMPMEDDFERRKQLYRIKELLKSLNCTSVLISEAPSEASMSTETASRFSRYDVEEFLCDSVTALYYAGIGGESDRAIRVIKMRKTAHNRAPIPMEIGKLGIRVLSEKAEDSIGNL